MKTSVARTITGINQRWEVMIHRLPPNTYAVIAAVVVFGGIGTYLLAGSHAATPTASLEAESGTLAGCATSLSDTTASGSAAVKLGGCSTGSTPPLSLDASGATIPDTNYAIPSGAIYMATTGSDSNAGTLAAPVKTLNKAISLVPSGGTIVARGGTYRDWYNSGGSAAIASNGFTLQAYPHEQVWFDGADVQPTANWTSDGSGHWYMAWNTSNFCGGQYYAYPYNAQASDNSGPCSHWDNYGNTEANYPAAGDPQMVFIDGARMAEVDTLSGATGGKFYYDWTNKRIYISTNPSGHTVELAARPGALILGGSTTYTLRGIGFKRYASDEYDNINNAAVYIGGNGNDTVENVVFTQMAGNGLFVAAPNGTTLNSIIASFNGFDGVGANGHGSSGSPTDNFQVTNSVFNNNNLEHFGLNCSLSCAAAGMKMGHMVGFTVKNNIFENTISGDGTWCDTSCSNGVVVNNYIANNGSEGYSYEIDTNGIVASNVFINNGTGIETSSPYTSIYNNTFINNPLISIEADDDNRSDVTSNVAVGNNIVYGTSVNDTYFARLSGAQSGPNTFMTYLDYNSYWRPNSFTLYRWIDGSDSSYSSSSSFSAAHSSFATHDQDTVGGSDPFFTNFAGGDYTVRSSSAAYHSGGAIPSNVANALGVSTAAGQTRGAFSWPGSN